MTTDAERKAAQKSADAVAYALRKKEEAAAYARMKAEAAEAKAQAKASALESRNSNRARVEEEQRAKAKAKAEAADAKAREKALILEAQTRKRAEIKEARIARFRDGSDWRHSDLSTRSYEDYADYVQHQSSKLESVRDALETRFEETVTAFQRRFELIELKSPSSVLCLGARLGQEVAAFASLGHFAVGVDLNPGSANRFVVAGDFHHLQFADRSIDCVYINSVDHILDLERITAEIHRVLKADGLFVAEIVSGYEEGFWAGEFETLHWPRALDFAKTLAAVGRFDLRTSRSLQDVGAPMWLQAEFVKKPL